MLSTAPSTTMMRSSALSIPPEQLLERTLCVGSGTPSKLTFHLVRAVAWLHRNEQSLPKTEAALARTLVDVTTVSGVVPLQRLITHVCTELDSGDFPALRLTVCLALNQLQRCLQGRHCSSLKLPDLPTAEETDISEADLRLRVRGWLTALQARPANLPHGHKALYNVLMELRKIKLCPDTTALTNMLREVGVVSSVRMPASVGAPTTSRAACPMKVPRRRDSSTSTSAPIHVSAASAGQLFRGFVGILPELLAKARAACADRLCVVPVPERDTLAEFLAECLPASVGAVMEAGEAAAELDPWNAVQAVGTLAALTKEAGCDAEWPEDERVAVSLPSACVEDSKESDWAAGSDACVSSAMGLSSLPPASPHVDEAPAPAPAPASFVPSVATPTNLPPPCSTVSTGMATTEDDTSVTPPSSVDDSLEREQAAMLALIEAARPFSWADEADFICPPLADDDDDECEDGAAAASGDNQDEAVMCCSPPPEVDRSLPFLHLTTAS